MNLRPSLVELVVADMAASLAFYRRLGLDIPPGADTEPHVSVDLGGLQIAFDTEDTIRSFDKQWTRPPAGGHRMALAFACGSPAEVDAAWADLTGAGYEGHLEPWDALWGMRYAVVHDPDGNPVDLFAPLAGRAAAAGRLEKHSHAAAPATGSAAARVRRRLGAERVHL